MQVFLSKILVFGFLLSTYVVKAQLSELRAEIDKIIKYDTDLEIDDNPGFIISVLDEDSLYHLPYGKIYSDHSDSPSADDIYEIGSITKSFTALLTLELHEQGLINLTDAVNHHMHPNHQNPRLDYISIHDLLTHQSGLPKRPDLIGRKMRNATCPYQYYDKHDLLRFYSSYVPQNKTEFQYSHTNYGLLEIILENATGESIDHLLRQYIFEPLSMTDTYIDWPKENKESITPGYDKASRLTEAWKYGSHSASEGCKSSANDLTIFVNHYINVKEHSLGKVMNQSLEVQVPKSISKSISTAYGWQIYTRKKNGYPIYTYTGRTSGHNAFIAFVKETKTAVILLSNSVLGTEDLGLQILRMINYNWKRKV